MYLGAFLKKKKKKKNLTKSGYYWILFCEVGSSSFNISAPCFSLATVESLGIQRHSLSSHQNETERKKRKRNHSAEL
jgi:hypothetical protein